MSNECLCTIKKQSGMTKEAKGLHVQAMGCEDQEGAHEKGFGERSDQRQQLIGMEGHSG